MSATLTRGDVLDRGGEQARTSVRQARRRPRRRSRLVVAVLGLGLLAAFAVRVLLGDFTFTIPDFFRILFGAEIPGATFILIESKLPRALLGVMVGAAFGVAGAIFQTTLRNPLASPDVIGVSLGASAAAVFAIVSLDQSGAPVAAAAIIGAVSVSAVVRVVAGPGSGHRLVLIGVAVAAALSSVIQYLFTRADVYDAQLALRWLTGSLNQVDWPTIQLLSGFLLILLPVLWWCLRSLRITELGQDAAAGLGVGPRRSDLLLLLAVVLCAVAVAAAGPVAFVSFLAGPISRALNAGRTTIVGAGLVGAIVVVAADHAAAYLVDDINFPVGVVTGAFGAPFLLWLLARGHDGRRAA